MKGRRLEEGISFLDVGGSDGSNTLPERLFFPLETDDADPKIPSQDRLIIETWWLNTSPTNNDGWKEVRFVMRVDNGDGKEAKVVLSNGRAVMRRGGVSGERSML